MSSQANSGNTLLHSHTHTLYVGEPLRLAVVFRGAGGSVEEHQQQHQPVEISGFDSHTAVLPDDQIQVVQLLTEKEKNRQIYECIK